MDIELHIEQLILEGVDVPQHTHARLQAAVTAELTRLLAADGVASQLLSSGAVGAVRGGEIQVAGGDVTELGGQIARAIYGGIGYETTDRGGRG
jgi:hypothetical protein